MLDRRWWIGSAAAATLAAALFGRSVLQSPAIHPLEETGLREYAGVYQGGPESFLYLQLWSEFAGSTRKELVALDESGEIRTLYPTGPDQFVAGPGAAVRSSVESRIEFHRAADERIVSLTWGRSDGPPRVARRVAIERHEEIRFANGGVQLAGTLIAPAAAGPHPAVILVHGSGPADREWGLPFARFLVRHGMAVLGYDKRGVGASTGDWNTASFEDLAGDAIAAFEHLKKRPDIDRARIGLLGVSQAGWVMPIAAVRAQDVAFLISISGPGVPGAETTIDHARNEMTASGMKRETVEQIVGVMELQYEFARTGQGWDEYLELRQDLADRLGSPPDIFPATQDHPYWQTIRRLYFYDPVPTLRRLQVPVLALFGELDNNILPGKSRAAWEAALKAGGNTDYTLLILPRANHLMLEAARGNNAEIGSLQRIVPAYFSTIREWLAKRIHNLGLP